MLTKTESCALLSVAFARLEDTEMCPKDEFFKEMPTAFLFVYMCFSLFQKKAQW